MRFDWENWIRGRLSPARLNHCRQVAALASDLAPLLGADPEAARLAGLLHDAAREWVPADWLKTAEAFGIVVTDVEKEAPVLLHGPIAAELVRREGLTDLPILRAIAFHTTASPNWDGLGRAIYLADHLSDRKDLTERAFRDPEGFYWRLLGFSLRRAIRNGLKLSPHSLAAWNEKPPSARGILKGRD